MTGPRRSAPGRARKLARIAIALGLLALLWRAADGPEAARSLAAADWRLLALALLALTLQTVLSALRWRLTARQLGITLGTGTAIREYYLSQIVNQSLPGGMLGDAGRAVRSRAHAGLLAAGQAVVFERLAGQIAMFATLAVAFLVTLVIPGGLDWPGWLIPPVATLLAVGAALPVILLAGTHMPGATGRSILSLCDAIGTALAARSVLPRQIVLSLGTTFCNLAAFDLCARAVGVDLGLAAVTALVPLILLTMLVPITISGWGLREGAAATLLPLAGVTASGGLAASVAFGLLFAVSVLPGVVLLWVDPKAARHDTITNAPDPGMDPGDPLQNPVSGRSESGLWNKFQRKTSFDRT
ncbi:lysylphosphatidylglycerol synthase transmembrane domain-containing protein [Tropicimonas sp. IMCC6043]|uniref:lysylphosphatidylglycerol synthase transmembrane domain-containing protein n=1 Tax=Tropicimonas sp. IMCC6043 TaxID=2510645 RepID=UPI00101D731C|nr:lysylphosphatidylglycerol synthase transmembrane domain-containing protein [Tropicimonas sp. IMCC6043]RYH07950.1 flippase-like domain-containing protein [Tropicimonas sp. IMCC6043]